MDTELQIVLDDLADYLFAVDEPTPEGLEQLRRRLSGYESLASLFLNLRLTLRWRGFGVTHSSIAMQPLTAIGTVPFKIRAYDPASMEAPFRRVLTRAQFLYVSYSDEAIGMGGWVTATASAPLVQRLRG